MLLIICWMCFVCDIVLFVCGLGIILVKVEMLYLIFFFIFYYNVSGVLLLWLILFILFI